MDHLVGRCNAERMLQSGFDGARGGVNEYTNANNMQEPKNLLIGFRLAVEEGKKKTSWLVLKPSFVSRKT
jgi:hypothetical protein